MDFMPLNNNNENGGGSSSNSSSTSAYSSSFSFVSSTTNSSSGVTSEAPSIGLGAGGGSASLSNQQQQQQQAAVGCVPATVSSSSSSASAVVAAASALRGKVDQKTFETSLSEIYQFKQCISQKIKQLEQAIGRLKSLVLVYEESDSHHTSSSTPSASSAEPRSVSQQSIMGKKRSIHTSNTNGTAGDSNANGSNHVGGGLSTRSSPSPSQADLLELRTILTDIDLHLAVLKDVEERHALICESYSLEIRARDETLHTKAHQIQAMGMELASLQSKIAQLTIKNQHLETEIKKVKVHTGALDDKITGKLTAASDQYLIDLEQSKQQQQFYSFSLAKSSIKQSKANDNEETTKKAIREQEDAAARKARNNAFQIASNVAEMKNYEQMYFNLLKQYRQFEAMLLSAGANRGFDSSNPNSLADGQDKSQKAIPLEHKSTTINMHPLDGDDDDHENNEKETSEAEQDLANLNEFVDVMLDDEAGSGNQQFDSSNVDLEMQKHGPVQQLSQSQLQQNPKKNPKKVTINLNNTKVSIAEPSFGELGIELNAIKEEEEDSPSDTDVGPSAEKRPLLAHSERHHDDHELDIDEPDNDMARTSKSAYEHFVKMQQDLQKLMKSEETYRLKSDELEQAMEELRTAKEDDEYKLSEATYELDILKHNYDLEMESFGSAVTERESLIEKLQQKVEALRRKYQTLDERLQSSINKEVEYKSQIEEAEGRVKYEQLQRQTVIDSRVNELELQLAAIEAEHQQQTADIQQELGAKSIHEQELQSRIDELEASLKNLVLSNSTGVDGVTNGEQLAAVEDEFAYYKNRIEALMKELEAEKQDRQRLSEKHEEELKLKDKTYDQLREQIRKDKDAQLREKNEFDQKYRKLATKFKVKEREINSLHEKLNLLNDKFKAREAGELGLMEFDSDSNPNPPTKSEEQLMTELALNELHLSELRTKLENAEEHLSQLTEGLVKERERRREIESHYLSGISGRNRSKGFFWGLFSAIIGGGGEQHAKQDDWSTTFEDQYSNYLMTNQPFSSSANQMYLNHSLHASAPHHRNSTSSLALLMEDHLHGYGGMAGGGPPGMMMEPEDEASGSLFGSIARSVRRQKNIFIFGSRKEKTIRVALAVYLILVHFYAFEYYLG